MHYFACITSCFTVKDLMAMRYKSMLLALGKTGKLNFVCIDFKMLKSIIPSLPTDK